MRIACITNSLIPSTTANSIQVMKVCDAMRQAGHEICIWAPGKFNTNFNQMKSLYGLESDFEVRWLPSVRKLRRYDFAISTLHAANRWGAEMVYTWLPQVAVGALVLGLPTALEAHDRATGRFGLFWLIKFLKSNGKKQLVLVSQALKHALETQAGFMIPEDDVIIAPNGVDLKRYANLPTSIVARKELGLNEQVTLGYTGHFYAGRGVEILFQLAKAYPNVQHLWIGGREEELALVRIRLITAGMKNVVLTGFIDNTRLAKYQSACDILVMPYERVIAGSSGGNSADICSPMKMFEYMAAGKAIISSDLPVIHEVLNQDSALFCPPEDADAWIAAVNLLVNDPVKREVIGKRAQAVIQDLSIQKRQKRILQFMESSG